MGQQRCVGLLRPLPEDVVRVNDEAGQAMLLSDQSDLAFPEIGIEKAFRTCISSFWDELERGFDSVGIVQVHQMWGEVSAPRCFHIMRHDRATWRPIRPEPNEGNAVDSMSLEQQKQQLLTDALDS